MFETDAVKSVDIWLVIDVSSCWCFFVKQKTAYEMRMSDWSSDVCSSDLRDLMAELKELRLHGMATAWAELTAQGESNTASSKWLLEHLQIGRASCRERVCQYV